MSHLYADFDENDDLEGNDDDIGALGSILSWDDEDEQDGAVSRTEASKSAALRERDMGTSGTSVPPDIVQFSMKDGAAVRFLQYPTTTPGTATTTTTTANTTTATTAVGETDDINASNMVVAQHASQASGDSNDASNNITLQLPMPTPVGNLQQADTNETNTNDSNRQQQQQQFAAAAAQGQPALAGQPTFAPFYAAQLPNANLATQQPTQIGQAVQQPLQIQQQQQSTENQQQTRPQNQQPGQPPPPPVAPTIQPQLMQIPFTGDPNAFLQQLQFAQLQQQFQQQVAAAAAAAPQANVHVNSAATQQFQAQFAQPQANAAALQTAVVPAARQTQPPKKKAKATPLPPTKKAPPSKTPGEEIVVGRGDLSIAGIVSASDTDGDPSKEISKKSSAASQKKQKADPADNAGLSTADKAKANRDRNREHARNTRLRKKAYLEKLKATVDDLCRERDTLVSERAGAANLLVEMHNTRTEVLMSFFALRSSNEKRRELWASILDESCFACTLPVTPYRPFPASEVQLSKCQRNVLGIDGMMADTASLHVLLDSLIDRSKHPNGKFEVRYTLVTEEAVVAGNQMMARWVMTTTNASQLGVGMDISKQGMLCCKFNSAHKITALEILFDVMSFMLQIKQAAGADGFSVIPNTVQACQRSFDKPMAMTLAEPPYTIVQVNKLWEDLTLYTADDVVGKVSSSILRRQGTDKSDVEWVMEEIRYKRPLSAILIHYKKTGERFREFVLMFPLSTDSRITHYLSLTQHADSGPDTDHQQQKRSAPQQAVVKTSSSSSVISGTNYSVEAPPPRTTSTLAVPVETSRVAPLLMPGVSSLPPTAMINTILPGSTSESAAMAKQLGQMPPPAPTTLLNIPPPVSRNTETAT